MGAPARGNPGDPVVDRVLRQLAPPGARVGSRWIDAADIAGLRDEEQVAVARAVPKRRREFASGRALLRQLLAADVVIPVAADRRPVLPAGVVGSLAHDDHLVVGIVAVDATLLALGIDTEPATPLADDLAAVILRPDDDAVDAHLAFTLKEAAYKAWAGLGGGLLDHHDVRLAVTGEGFAARVVGTDVTIRGRYARAGSRWLAVATCPNPGLGHPE